MTPREASEVNRIHWEADNGGQARKGGKKFCLAGKWAWISELSPCKPHIQVGCNDARVATKSSCGFRVALNVFAKEYIYLGPPLLNIYLPSSDPSRYTGSYGASGSPTQGIIGYSERLPDLGIAAGRVKYMQVHHRAHLEHPTTTDSAQLQAFASSFPAEP